MDKGFTLIELMVTIAIIGILSAIAIPNMISYSKKDNEAAALSECKEVYTAFVNYYTDNGEYPLKSKNPAFQLDTFSPLDYQGSIFSRKIKSHSFRWTRRSRPKHDFD